MAFTARNAHELSALLALSHRYTPSRILDDAVVAEVACGVEGLWWWAQGAEHPSRLLERALAMVYADNLGEVCHRETGHADLLASSGPRPLDARAQVADCARAIVLGTRAVADDRLPGKVVTTWPSAYSDPGAPLPARDPADYPELCGYTLGHARAYPHTHAHSAFFEPELRRFLEEPDRVDGHWQSMFFRHVAVPLRSSRLSAERGASSEAWFAPLFGAPSWCADVDWLVATKLWAEVERKRLSNN